jgi:hypothetical protein
MIQNHSVTSGTLLSSARLDLTASDPVLAVTPVDRTDTELSQR